MRTEGIARYILVNPGKCIAIMLVLTIVFASGLYNFTMSMDIDDFLPESDEVEYLQTIQEEFFDMEVASFVTRGETVLTPTYFEETADIVEAWLAEPKVRDGLLADPTIAVITVPTMLANYHLMSLGNPQPTMEEVLIQARSYETEVSIKALASLYIQDPNIPQLYRDGFWMLLPTKTDHDLDPVPRKAAYFVQLRGDMGATDLEDVLLTMEDIAREEARSFETFMYADGALGHYMTEAEMMMEPIFGVLIIVLLLVLLLAFRRLYDTGLTMASLLLAVLWQIGMVSWLGFSLDLFQFMVPLLLMGLGIDFSLHLIMNYREGLGTEGTEEERLKAAVDKVFRVAVPALFLATVTTMVGFGSNLIFDYAIIMKFGVGAAFGILAVFLVNLFVVLPWQVLRDRRSSKQLEKGTIHVEAIGTEPGRFVRGGYRTMKFAPVLAATLVLLAIPGLVLAPTMKGTYDPRDELIDDQDLSIAASTLMEEFSMGTETLYIRVGGDWTDPWSWLALYEALEKLEATPYTNKVDGNLVADWVGPLIPAYAMMDPSIAALWSNVTEDGEKISNTSTKKNITLLLDALYAAAPEVSNYLHKEGSKYDAVLISIPTSTNWGEKGLELNEDVIESFEDWFSDIQITGTPIIWGVGFEKLADFMLQSVIIVVVFAFFFLIILNSVRRKDPVLGIITGIPPIMVLGWLFGTMWLANIPINLMTAMVGAIIIGLSIDYPIHIVNRWVYEGDKGASTERVYNITMGSTGREIVFSGATTLLALGTFFLLPMEAMRLFGIVLFIAILYSIIGALVLVPLMMRFWGGKERNPSD
jgi:predicted RND superfamily exporter protein